MEETKATEAVASEIEAAAAAVDAGEAATDVVDAEETETTEVEVVEAAVEEVEGEEIVEVEAVVEEVETVEDEAEATDAVETEVSETAKPTSIAELEPRMKLDGTVSRLELYGAFIDIGVGTNALIHISKLGKEQVNRVSDALEVGDTVSVWVDKVNPEQGQIMVTMIEPLAVEWTDLKKGQTYSGTIARLENYGAFVDIGAEREGLVHISEISHEYVKHPSEMLTVGNEVEVQVLDFSRRKRRIDLSIKNLLEKPESQMSQSEARSAVVEPDDFEEELEDIPTAMEVALRRAMGDEPIDAIEIDSKRGRRKNRKKKRQAQDDLLSRTLHFQQEN